MNEKCTIFAGGDGVSFKTLDMGFVAHSVIYGADKGYYLAKELGIECDIVIGDFDSSRKPEHDNILTFPVEKDDSDLSLTINHALENGCRDFQIYGALGGSVDHLYANITSLYFLVKNGASGVIKGDKDVIRLLTPGRHHFEKREGFSLSLFAYQGDVTGLSVSGTKYKCEDLTLTTDKFSLGLSNSVTDIGGADVSFSTGLLLVIESLR